MSDEISGMDDAALEAARCALTAQREAIIVQLLDVCAEQDARIMRARVAAAVAEMTDAERAETLRELTIGPDSVTSSADAPPVEG